MATRALLSVALIVLLGVSFVSAVGQIFVDKISPNVDGNPVVFEDSVFTPDALMDTMTTDTFKVLKQFEFYVPVSDIQLFGTTGISLIGSMGTAIASDSGDVTFSAVNGTVYFDGTTQDWDAFNDVDISSINGNVNLMSDLASSLIAGGQNFTASSGGIQLSSEQDIQFFSRNSLNLWADLTISFSTFDDVNFIADGSLELTAGTDLAISSANQIHADATNSVEFRSIQDISIATGGTRIMTTGQQISTLAVGPMSFNSFIVNVGGAEEVRLQGGSVSTTSSSTNFHALGMFSNMVLFSEDDVNLNASRDVDFTATGASADVVWKGDNYSSFASDTLSIDTGLSFIAGDDKTNSLDIRGTNGFDSSSSNFDAHSDDLLMVTSLGPMTFQSNDEQHHKGFTYTGVAYENLLLNADDDLFMTTDVSDAAAAVYFQSTVGNMYLNVVDQLQFKTFLLDTDIVNDITTSVNDVNMDTVKGESMFISAGGAFSISADTLEVNSDRFEALAGAITISMDESYVLEGHNFDSISDNDTDFIAQGSMSITSFGNIEIIGDNVNAIAGDDVTLESDTQIKMVSTDNVNLSSSDDIRFSASENLHILAYDHVEIDAQQDQSYDSDFMFFRTSIFNMFGGSIDISVDDVSAIFDSTVLRAGSTLTLDASSDLTLDSAGDLMFTLGGDLVIDATGSGTNTITVSSNEMSYVYGMDVVFMGSNTDISGLGNFGFSAGGDLSLLGANGLSFSDTLVQDNSISFAADGWFNVTASDNNLDGGAVAVSSGLGEDISLWAGRDVNIATIGPFADQISIWAMNTNFTTDQGNLNINAINDIIFGSSDLSLYGWLGSLTITGSLTVNMGTAMGSTNVTAMDDVNFSGDTLSVLAGTDNHFQATSNDEIYISAGSGGFTIDADSSIYYSAADNIYVWAVDNNQFNAGLDLYVSADTWMTIEANDAFVVSSYDDLMFSSAENYNMTVMSVNDDISAEFGRNMWITANGMNPWDNCGLTIEAIALDGVANSHSYSTVGTDFDGQTGNLRLLAQDGVVVYSFDETFNAGPPTTAPGGWGNIEVDSDGGAYYHSDNSGVVFRTAGTDPSGSPNAMMIETNDSDGNMEIVAYAAKVNFLADQDISVTNLEDLNFLGDMGVSVKTVGDELYDSDQDLFINGARGVTIAAGTDAPFFAGNFNVSADLVTFESQDSILFRSFSVVTGDDAIVFISDDFDVTSYDGRWISVNSSASIITDSRHLLVNSENGHVLVDADLNDLIIQTGTGVNVETTDGPISFRALGDLGTMDIEGEEWDFSSDNSYIRLFAQDDIIMVANDELEITSNTVGQVAGGCVNFQTENPTDDVILSSLGNFVVDVNSNGRVFPRDHLQFIGNNIDVEGATNVLFTIDELFEIGASEANGGEPSFQPVVRVVAGGNSTTTGVTMTSEGDIVMNTQNTFNTESTNNTLITSTSNTMVNSNGYIYLVAQGTSVVDADVSLTSEMNVGMSTDVLTQNAPSGFFADATGTIFVESSGTDVGDMLEMTSTSVLNSTDVLGHTFQADVWNSLSHTNTEFTTVGSFFALNSPDTFALQDYEETEQGYITISAGRNLNTTSFEHIFFNTLMAGSEITFSAADDIPIILTDSMNVYAANLELGGNDFSWTADSISIIGGITSNIEGAPFGEPDFESFTMTSEDRMDFSAVLDMNFQASADIIFNALNDISSSSGAATSIVTSGTALSYFEVTSLTSTIDYTANGGDLLFNNAFNSSILYDYDEEAYWTFTADVDINFDAPTSIDLLANLGDIDFYSTFVDMNIITQLTANSDTMHFYTEGYGSDIVFELNSPANDFPLTAQNDFEVESYGLTHFESNVGLDILASNYDMKGFADVVLDANNLNIDALGLVLLTATGTMASQNAGIRIDASSAISIFTESQLHFRTQEFVDTSTIGTLTITAADSLILYSTAANGNIEFTVLNNGMTLTATTEFVVNARNQRVTSPSTLTLRAQAGDMDFTTLYDHSDIQFVTNENRQSNKKDTSSTVVTMTSADDIEVRAEKYLNVKTYEKEMGFTSTRGIFLTGSNVNFLSISNCDGDTGCDPTNACLASISVTAADASWLLYENNVLLENGDGVSFAFFIIDESATYELVMFDSNGGGWSGSYTVTLVETDVVLATGTLAGSYGVATLTLSCSTGSVLPTDTREIFGPAMLVRAEQGKIDVDVSTASTVNANNIEYFGRFDFTSLTQPLPFVATNGDVVITTEDGAIEFLNTLATPVAPLSFSSAGNIWLETNGYGRNNDIHFYASANMDIDASTNIQIASSGSDGGFTVDASDDILVSASTAANIFGFSGFRTVTTRAVGTNSQPSQQLTASDDVFLVVEDLVDKILFQSDWKTRLRASNANARISQRTYNHRLAFFEVAPPVQINQVNVQRRDTCVRAQKCGFNSPQTAGEATQAIRQLEIAADQAWAILLNHGLIDWRSGYNP